MSNNNNSYDASNIDIFKGVNGVRKRPGMYIGDTDRKGLHHLINEITDNSVDEAIAGHCNHITIELFDENSIKISDNGRGIPVDIHPLHGISAATIIFTELHAGGKFNSNSYKVSGGLHGVGATVTNALSEFLEVYIKRNGSLYYQRFEKGQIIEELKEISKLDNPEETGTTVIFKPDPKMFQEALEEEDGVLLSLDYIKTRLKNTAYLTPKLKLTTIDRDGTTTDYYSENGITDYVKDLAPTLYKDSKFKDEDEDEDENESMFAIDIKRYQAEGVYLNPFDDKNYNSSVDIAFTYQNKFFGSNIKSFANNIDTVQGGKHVLGFESAFLKVINEYNVKTLHNQEIFLKEDILEGINAIISFSTEEPKFSDQTKQKLSTGDAQKLCYKATKEYLENLLQTDPDFVKYIISKSVNAKKMREQIDKKRNEVQKITNSEGGKPKKLSDCRIKTRLGTELFLVEGDSAGGSAKQGRNREFQAILPLKGKILNSLKHDDKKIENSDEVKSLRLALKTGTDDKFNIEKLRYEKIIIMCDADVDGAHIETLLLTYFITKMPELLENGCVYLAQPPLYVLKNKNGGAKVKSIYIQKEEELKEHYVNGVLPSNISKQRFKGLGEMNPIQLWETTMNPETRMLKQVILNKDNIIETKQIFEDLMGDKVEPRRDFIFENAINVDIEY